MSIIHVRQIEAKLKSIFQDLIDLDDYKKRPQTDKDSAFLTRALAAFTISAIADVEADKAAICVTDGFNDNGIDAIYFDDREKVLFLVQTKWKHDGSGSVERGDALKFITGAKDLINAEFDRFNDKVKNRSAEILDAISFANTRIILLLAYTGQGSLGQDIERDFDDFLREMNDPSDVVELRVLKQVNLHGIVASGALGKPINFDVIMRDWGQIRDPFPSYYGRVSATDVADWMDKYHPRIFSLNIRSFLSATEINQGIVETLLTEPENFWYFNNGLTVLCETVKKKLIGGMTNDSGIFECTNVSIVNGAQTVGAIATACAKSPEKIAKATVMVRFISLENCPDDFAARVTRTTNTQNRIESRDFISLDPEQERLRTELQLDGIEYVYKAGYNIRDTKNGFDLTEATVALACSHSESTYSVQAKGKISGLWEDVSKAPYKALFNSSVSSVKLWRLVQIYRAVENQLKSERGQGKEAMLPVHGNRFLARQVFKNLPTTNLDDPRTDFTYVLSLVPEMTSLSVKITMDAINEKYPDSYLANLFKNREKCQKIEDLVESYWNVARSF
jgi:hypothetical protein